ncbi:aminomethyl-transferring glycine dehydrogenase subunit GcvPA [Vallitalea okinawensis]|uniref:aminomethyl-transferring glycine dehydrogenase subunit GcvPA n=1 Tax=Vallitalea okinawensis TaxID=2078660 RepID=UPI000CFAEC48|nr:aminomethyl-transferring glycine dehydrogenase subunit GcvPA [Vallitalea okinawensis]
MHPYLPHTDEDIQQMLKSIGVETIEELFHDIPEEIRLKEELKVLKRKSEFETRKDLKNMSNQNINLDGATCFLGAGAYDHYIPSTIAPIVSRSEFFTAYTPYQPEISQGTLQVIFEYQSMICELTGMDVSNASLYDGATATAEAAFMACGQTRRNKVIMSSTVHPMVRDVVKTYLDYKDIELVVIDETEGKTDVEKVLDSIDKTVATVIIQSPNFYGKLEDVEKIAEKLHENKGLLIMNVDPISLGIYKSPGACGADIVVGEGQSLGNPLNFGGPYLGFIACKQKFMRKLPGRIVGQTEDVNGKRAFVLTLQAREQHIRREKATSNITSNQALCALMATIYLATMGKEGLKEVASNCIKKAHYMAERLQGIEGVDVQMNQPFFKEFVISIDSDKTIKAINKQLLEKGFIGGYDLGKTSPLYENKMLLCVTEKRTRAEIDQFVKELEGIL